MAEKGRYTKFSNKIGLYSNSKGSFIKNDTSVVLNFPFKDAVLEGGMSKEDRGREERFLHVELDSKDIDTLEEPKVLTAFRYVSKNGEKPLSNEDIEFFDEDNNLKQNLLIKGNNLLALHTLKERLAGQVKLIYIDPPYNTGGDGFRYNDSFNHSAWLAFMKNRLEVAKDLLRDDGAIFVHCDDNEQAYLKVLADEVFGRDNFISTLVIKGGSGRQDSVNFAKTHEFIVTYAKDIDSFNLNKNQVEDTSSYSKTDENGRKYKTQLLRKWGSNDRREDRPSLYFPVELGGETFLPVTGSGGDGRWRWKLDNIRSAIEQGYIEAGTTPSGKRELYQRIYQDDNPMKSVTYASILEGNLEDSYSGKGSRELSELFNGKAFDSPKSELMMKQIIEMVTDAGDIVLDYHVGSGTTAAVAQKMGRRWIGVEQMDYIEDVTKERLKKVVAGEQGGISKTVEWNGGGSFVYFELKKYNQEYIDRIMEATSLSELEELYVDMRNNAFLKFWFDRNSFEKDEDFRKLDLDGRKEALADVLDENQLYLNYADMNDTRHNVSDEEKSLTDKFYGSK